MQTEIIEKEHKIGLVSVPEKLDDTNVLELMRALNVFNDQKIKWIIINLKDTEYVSSSGTGIIASTSKKIHEDEGKICVICAQDRIKSLFKITKLDSIVFICGTLEEALKKAT